MKYTIEATIPTTQYGNIRPKFELDTDEEQEQAFRALSELWQRFGETPLKDKQGGGVKMVSLTGEEILYDDATHSYFDLNGNRLMSGSEYADLNSPKFDMDMLAPKSAKDWGVEESKVREIWKASASIANNYGSAIHDALEAYHKYHKIGAQIQEKRGLEENYILPKNPHIRETVLQFVNKFGADALAEVLVSDVANKRAGRIDRLQILDNGVCRIGDYKTNADLDSKKKLKYQKQLSFYAAILQAKGWKVLGLDLFHLDPVEGWVKTEMEVLPLDK
jgi:hypothetical protein